MFTRTCGAGLQSLLVIIICYLYMQSYFVVRADEGFYKDSLAAFVPELYPSLTNTYLARNIITLSPDPYAGTNNTVYATYIGDFSSSGPHAIVNLTTPASVITNNVTLDRRIGNLQSIWIENQGYDSLLISTWSVRIRENIYDIAIPEIWLQTFDPILKASTGDGYSPNADLNLPSSCTLLLEVSQSYLYYSSTGLNAEN